MISSFFSGPWREAMASEASQKPSRWMPPLTATGRRAAPAAASSRVSPSPPQRNSQSHTAPPAASPMKGKAQRAYFIPSRSHSTWGMGMADHMEKAITKERSSITLGKPPSRTDRTAPPGACAR